MQDVINTIMRHFKHCSADVKVMQLELLQYILLFTNICLS